MTVLTLGWCLLCPQSPGLHGGWHLADDAQDDASPRLSLCLPGRSQSDWGDPSPNISEPRRDQRIVGGWVEASVHMYTLLYTVLRCLPGQCDCPLWPWLMGLISKLFPEPGGRSVRAGILSIIQRRTKVQPLTTWEMTSPLKARVNRFATLGDYNRHFSETHI